eukprot:5731252-Alexandrium_andersonii.AAC.1
MQGCSRQEGAHHDPAPGRGCERRRRQGTMRAKPLEAPECSDLEANAAVMSGGRPAYSIADPKGMRLRSGHPRASEGHASPQRVMAE